MTAWRDYDPVHLLDYLSLGVAGYLWPTAAKTPALHSARFDVLRWGWRLR